MNDIARLQWDIHILEHEYNMLEYDLKASTSNYPNAPSDIVTYTRAEMIKRELAQLNKDLEFLMSIA